MAEKKPFFQRLKAKAHEIKKETYTLALAYRHPKTPWYASPMRSVPLTWCPISFPFWVIWTISFWCRWGLRLH